MISGKLSNQIKKSEERIEELENKIKSKSEILSNPTQQKNLDFDQISQDYNQLQKTSKMKCRIGKY